jgi:hypothetical protein
MINGLRFRCVCERRMARREARHERQILYLRRPIPNRDGINDFASTSTTRSGMARATDTSLRTKMPNQLLFQYATGLHEQTSINRLV